MLSFRFLNLSPTVLEALELGVCWELEATVECWSMNWGKNWNFKCLLWDNKLCISVPQSVTCRECYLCRVLLKTTHLPCNNLISKYYTFSYKPKWWNDQFLNDHKQFGNPTGWGITMFNKLKPLYDCSCIREAASQCLPEKALSQPFPNKLRSNLRGIP